MKREAPVRVRERARGQTGERTFLLAKRSLSVASQRTLLYEAQHSAGARVYIIYSEPLSSALRQVSHLRPQGCARPRGFDDERSREKVAETTCTILATVRRLFTLFTITVDGCDVTLLSLRQGLRVVVLVSRRVSE